MKKRMAVLAGLLVLLGIFSGCAETVGKPPSVSGSSPRPVSSVPAVAPYEIGLVQYADTPTLNEVRESFMSRLEEWGYGEEKVKIEYKNVEGQQEALAAVCKGFVEQGVELIVAVSTPAAQAAVEAARGSQVKVLFAGVSNPIRDLKLSSQEAGFVTGTSDQLDVKAVVDLALAGNPALTTLGILSHNGEPNSLGMAEEARAYAQEKGLTVVADAVNTEEEYVEKCRGLGESTQGILVTSDTTAEGYIKKMAEAVEEKGIPLYATNDGMVRSGACGGLSISYGALGSKTADMAVRLISGTPIEEVPVVSFTEAHTFLNQQTMTRLGITFPSEIEEAAHYFE